MHPTDGDPGDQVESPHHKGAGPQPLSHTKLSCSNLETVFRTEVLLENCQAGSIIQSLELVPGTFSAANCSESP